MLEERLRKWKENQEASWRREWSEEWKEQYLSKGRQEMLLDAIEDRFGVLPKPVVAYIMSEQDSQELLRLLRSVFTAESLDAFCSQLKSGQA